jgi:hypothetical protein
MSNDIRKIQDDAEQQVRLSQVAIARLIRSMDEVSDKASSLGLTEADIEVLLRDES